MSRRQAQRPVILGAGANGLVAAWRLAQAGLRPLVLEQREQVGGLAATREFFPRFRASAPLLWASPLIRPLRRALQQKRFSLLVCRPVTRAAVLGEDGVCVWWAEAEACARSLAQRCAADAASYARLRRTFSTLQPVFERFLLTEPPVVGRRPTGSVGLLAWQARRLGRRAVLELLRWLPMPIADWAADWFQAEPARVALAATGVWATSAGPYSPGTTARLLLQATIGGDLLPAVWVPRGGLGAVSRALAQAAQQAGAEIRTAARVERIAVEQERVSAVLLDSGEAIVTDTVVSALDLQTTFLHLVEPQHLPVEFLHQVQHFRSEGSLACVVLALDGLPACRQEDLDQQVLAGRVILADSVEQMERAFDHWKYGELSPQPLIECTFPSLLDDSLAPPGKHVLAAWVQFVPRTTGRPEERADTLLQTVLARLSQWFPDLPERVLGYEVLTAEAIEREWGLLGGHLFHGDLMLDQMFVLRPVYGWANYRTPVRGLYLCGSCTHPGLGLTGASGYNAARAVCADRRGA